MTDTALERITAHVRAALSEHWESRLQRALVDGSTPEAERLEILEQLEAALAGGDPEALEKTMAALHAVASRATVAAQACALIRTATAKIKASLDAPRPVLVNGGLDGHSH